jgi:type III restriction enzyme
MAVIRLKTYQSETLDVLRDYLERARYSDAKEAFDHMMAGLDTPPSYKPLPAKGCEATPYVCLRLPTGGGKTLLSAYTVQLAAESYIEREYPVTIWFVPSDAIKTQTLETLKNPRNANRIALDNAFEGRFAVYDIADYEQIRPQDLRDRACIIVSTVQSFRVEDTTIRKVYAHNENLEPHFAKIPAHSEGLEMREEDPSKIKYSLANLLAFHKPLVIVDEAHNSKSDLSFEMFSRIRPSCVVEYTATPADNSNILYSVSAAQLKAEQMIKLPIMLSEHKTWQQAVGESVLEREKLHKIAQKDKDYIRPIILFQAESADNDVTVKVLLNELVENNNIDRRKIAIATGNQKELDDVDLFDPNCPIEYVITIQALKEGWDCPFAYILCSVANTRSKTAIEQLLGRVLRMPYAKTRTQPELNKAYAHVSSKTWMNAQNQLHERLVCMGFEAQEAKQIISIQSALGLDDQPQQAFMSVTLGDEPDLEGLDLEEKASVEIVKEDDDTFTLKVKGQASDSLVKKLEKTVKGKDKKALKLAVEIYQEQAKAAQSPAQKGVVFEIPQLALQFDDGLELAEAEVCLYEHGWDILDYPAELTKDEFSVSDDAKHYTADIEGKKVVVALADRAQQLSLDGIETTWTEIDLSLWLDKRLRQADIQQEKLVEFLRRVIRFLLSRSDLDMPKLALGKFILEKVLRDKIEAYRKQATKAGFQACLFSKNEIATVDIGAFTFAFDPMQYPANKLYSGQFKFPKHYYAQIGDMNKEEVECALAIERDREVEVWVRNLERNPLQAFWLPTSTDKFYPDFIAKLKDGRLLVVEYKGGHLDNDDTDEKEAVGKLWAKKSGNLFLMAWKQKNGKDVYQQLNAILSA